MPLERPSAGQVRLRSTWWTPADVKADVVLAHSGEPEKYPFRESLREFLLEAGYQILEVFLVGQDESHDRLIRYDIPLLARRLADVGRWADRNGFARQPIILDTGNAAPAALWLGSRRFSPIRAVASICGRPHLAEPALGAVRVRTLLLVDAKDPRAQHMNRIAAKRLGKTCRLLELTDQNRRHQFHVLVDWVNVQMAASTQPKLALRARITGSLPGLALLRSLISLALFFSLVMVWGSANSTSQSIQSVPAAPRPPTQEI